MRPFTAAVSALAVGLPLMVVPTSAHAAEVTNSVTYPQTCRAIPNRLADPQDNRGQDVRIETTAPATVEVGKTITVKMKVNTGKTVLDKLPFGARVTDNARLKIDLALPDGFELQSALLSSDTNVQGLSAFTVNERGEKDPNGRILRLASADNATIANSPNASVTGAGNANNHVTGSTLEWLLPTLTMRLKATKPGTASLGLRHKGSAEQYASPTSYMTFNVVTDAGIAGTVYAATYCSPRTSPTAPFFDGARHLFDFTVIDKQPAQKVTVNLATERVAAGELSPVTATVTPADAAGTVTFTAADRSVTAPVVAGRATANMVFPQAGQQPVQLAFTPRDAEKFLPAQGTGTVEAGARPAELTIMAPRRVSPGSEVTIQVVTPAAATGKLVFSSDGKTLGSADIVAGQTSFTFNAGNTEASRTIDVAYQPDQAASLAPNTASVTIQVEETADTTLTLAADATAVPIGSTTALTATITPAKGTTARDIRGTLAVTVGGQTIRHTVTGATSTVDLPVSAAGQQQVTAVFYPEPDSRQTIATAETAIVGKTTGLSLRLTPPATVTVGTPAIVQIAAVTSDQFPARGTATATVHGRTTSANLVDGVAELPVILTDTQPTPVTVTVTDPQGLTATETLTLRAEPSLANDDIFATDIVLDLPESGKANTFLTGTATVTTSGRPTDGGYVSVQVDGAALQRDGKPVAIPVVNGKAAFQVNFAVNGTHQVQVVYHNDAGDSGNGVTSMVVITGGRTPATGTEHQPTGIMAWFTKLIEWFTHLFSGGSSSAS
ncbi:hypothetical protein CCHOA_09115 [Corynebacterium choanae]|uniref:Ig-like domain repeat protein n=2 Tax=Corynebacterium choanae TaxID=1862358 RepID=A0A3G6J893_9CORY|nr:hypothetical protein CCHOA_09115 [Corynebacterium choanae]